MGRIRTKFVKRTADKLVSLHKKSFVGKFDEDKHKVAELTNVSSKKLRNQIAGYITKRVKAQSL